MTKLPCGGFELQKTLGAASSDEDHYTMPLSQVYKVFVPVNGKYHSPLISLVKSTIERRSQNTSALNHVPNGFSFCFGISLESKCEIEFLF